VAVVGGGLGGLSAAGLLAREGLDVTLFEQGAALGGKAQAVRFGDTVLDTGPTLLTLPAVVRETFEKLGATDLLPELIELGEQCAYHWPGGEHFTAHRDLDATAAAVGAVWPDEAAHVGAFYREAEAIWRAAGEPYLEAPFDGMADFFARVVRRGPRAVAAGMRLGTLAGLGASHFRAEGLRQFVGRFATYAGASPFEASAAFALIPHIERAFRVFHVRGGMGALSAALGRAAARAGVRTVLGQRATWAAEGKGFRVGDEAFDAVIVNADPLASLGREREPLSMSGYVLLLEFPQRLSLPHHTVSFSADSRREFDQLFKGVQPDDPTLYFCHPAATDETVAAPGTSGLFVMANAPALAAAPGADAVWSERARAGARAVPGAGAAARAGRGAAGAGRAHAGGPGQAGRAGRVHLRLPAARAAGALPEAAAARGGAGALLRGRRDAPGGGVPLVLRSGQFAATLALAHLRGAA
jgi:phytoene desaturase